MVGCVATDGFMSKQSNGYDTSVQVYLIQPLWFGDSVDGQTQKVTLNRNSSRMVVGAR